MLYEEIIKVAAAHIEEKKSVKEQLNAQHIDLDSQHVAINKILQANNAEIAKVEAEVKLVLKDAQEVGLSKGRMIDINDANIKIQEVYKRCDNTENFKINLDIQNKMDAIETLLKAIN